MATLRAGSMPSRVTIQSVARTADDYGGFSNVWAPITNGVVWARVEQVPRAETAEGDQTLLRREYQVTIRDRSVGPINSTMRVLWKAKTLSVKDVVSDDTDRSRIILRCLEEPTA